MQIGVLAVQGAIEEHVDTLSHILNKNQIMRVKTLHHLKQVNALIIPGGESTAISRLIQKNQLYQPLKKTQMPIMGTCAGTILLAKKGGKQIKQTKQKLLGHMDIQVERNAFGRQKESFETTLNIPILGKQPFPGIFIRAPAITQILSRKVRILAEHQGLPIAVQQGNKLALSFHPELSDDTRFHEYFLNTMTKEF
ncbi:pyridoxal 5'-phosphate synthase glutaminase subunit PdxT [archaeon]|nr:pyridoxal 5'-phosphate synthase glutaminase subunit PdxT [archaeon]